MAKVEISLGSHLFWSGAAGLPTGTTLKSGNLQREMLNKVAIQVQTASHLVTIPDPASTGALMLELAWETVRLREFPHRPSRLDCVFFWPKEESAQRFHSRRSESTGLYEVEVVECSRVFVANMNLISYFEKSETVASMFERARHYWSTGREDGEVLLEGSARIVAVLNRGSNGR